MKSKLYFCTDIEADGPLVGVHSMLSVGCVVLNESGIIKGSCHFNLVPHGEQDENTMKWWKRYPKAWEALKEPKPLEPDAAMDMFAKWVNSFDYGRRIFTTDAPWFDWAWVRWYLIKYTGSQVFDGYFPYTWVARGAKINLPFIGNPHPHVSIYDAQKMAEQVKFLLKAASGK